MRRMTYVGDLFLFVFLSNTYLESTCARTDAAYFRRSTKSRSGK